MNDKAIFILGAKINDLSLARILDKIEKQLQTKQKAYIVTPNPEICLIGYKDKNFRRILRDSFISLPDGFGLKLGAGIIGYRLNNITTGINLSYKLLGLAEQKSYSVLLLGGQEESGLKAINKIKDKHPGLKINYLNGGNFNNYGKSDEYNLNQKINQLKPDIIFVNLGAPKQEYFIKKNLEKLETKLMLGVGGSLDFISGKIKRAPKFWQKIGLEWLWRLVKEPWRYKRIFKAVILFPLACLRFKYGLLFTYRNNVAGFVINKDKKILVAKHAMYDEWKFPQGGAKQAKTEKELTKELFKEMQQELGTDKFKVLKMLKKCHKYSFPKDYNFDHFKGQKQTLFLLEFLGEDSDIKLDLHEHTDFKWVDKEEIKKIYAKNRIKLLEIGLEKFKEYL